MEPPNNLVTLAPRNKTEMNSYYGSTGPAEREEGTQPPRDEVPWIQLFTHEKDVTT